MEGSSIDFGDSPAPVGSTEPSRLQQAPQSRSVEAISDPNLETTGNNTGKPSSYDVLTQFLQYQSIILPCTDFEHRNASEHGRRSRG
jgi:hypothetical protein